VFIKLSMVFLALVVLAGCREDRGSEARTAAQYQRMLDSSGKRVLVVDAAGEPVAKLRKRTAKYKVYDADLTATGFVSWEPADSTSVDPEQAAPDKTSGPRATVTARSLTKQDARDIAQVSEDNYELGGALRIERTDRGWAVFGPDAELVGLFERAERDSWSLRRDYGDGAAIEAKTSPTSSSLMRDGKKILEDKSGRLSALELLAFELEGIPTLHRVAVGAWMEHARPQG
jgi:hypothetical protein